MLANPELLSGSSTSGYWDHGRRHFMGTPFDAISRAAVTSLLTDCTATSRFRYVVTPNVDHVVRLNRNAALRGYYDGAWLSLCDSKPISLLARSLSIDLPLITGSDLTHTIFHSIVKDGDTVALIAANMQVVDDMSQTFPGLRFRAHVPPPGVWNNPMALQACIDFVAQDASRFVFIAIGSPQSERIAHALSREKGAHGVGFCIGAGLEFLVGARKRAPLWMRKAGLEWLHRLVSDPRRLWRRYLYAVIPLLSLFTMEIRRRLFGWAH